MEFLPGIFLRLMAKETNSRKEEQNARSQCRTMQNYQQSFCDHQPKFKIRLYYESCSLFYFFFRMRESKR